MLAEIIELLDMEMTEPGLYGWFHNLWLILIAVSTMLLCRFYKAGTPKQIFAIVFSVAVVVLVLEIYKQFNYTFSVKDGKVVGDYQWYAFPFQFCSTPMYVGLLAGIFRKGKIHQCLCAYLATYAVFAGLAVMVYPGDVFIDTIGINIQTMICHGSMIVVGIYLFYTGHVKAEHKTILQALPVFAVAVGLAVLMNELTVASGILKGEVFNMFFISRHFAPSLPVYSLVQQVVDYPWCLFIYILGFTAAAYIVLLVAIAIKVTETGVGSLIKRIFSVSR